MNSLLASCLLLTLLAFAELPSSAAAQLNGGVRAAPDSTSIELNVGEQRVMPALGVKTYSEGVKGIVDVRLTNDASRFVIIGLTKGITTLLLIMADGSERLISITVKDPRASNEAPQGKDPMAVDPRESIRLDLYFVQVNRTNSLDFGVSPGTQFGFGNFSIQYDIAAALVSKTAVVGSSFLPTLDMAQSRGWAKVRRHITVITTNGTQATFDSGGEFNAMTTQQLGPVVVSVKYGTVLSIQPRYDANSGRVELAVSAQVADLTPSASEIPGRSKSHVETVANLALGQSLAIAGLSSSSEEKTRSGIPYLSQIPVIGLLFGKQTKKENETENLVFISPSVVEPLTHARAKEFLSKAMREYDDYAGKEGTGRLFPGTPWAVPNQRAPVAQ